MDSNNPFADLIPNQGAQNPFADLIPQGRATKPQIPYVAAVKTIRDKVVGTPEFDYPSFDDSGIGDMLPNAEASKSLSRAMWSGSPETMQRAVTEIWPEATVQTDRSGYQYATIPGLGQFYTDRPGLDVEDVAAGASKAAAYGAAGLAGAAAKTYALGRAGLTGVAEALTDTGIQAAGGEQVNPIRSAVAGVAGASAELAGPVLSRLYQVYKRHKSLPAVREAAKEMGHDLSDTQIKALSREWVESGDELNDVIGRNEFGFVTTRGQRSGDFNQLAREERLRSTAGGEPLRYADEANRRAQTGEVARLTADSTANTEAARAADSLRGQASTLRGQIDEAYAGLGNPYAARSAVDELEPRFNQVLRREGVLLNDDLKATNAAYQIIRQGRARLDETGAKAVSLKEMDDTRRQLNRLYGRVANPEDRRALTMLKREYDDWIDDTLDGALFSGDAAALGQLKNARALRAEYGRKFQKTARGDDAGGVIEKLLDENRTPEEVANYLMGASSLGKANAARIVQRYKDAGGDPEPLRRLFMLKLTQGRGGQQVGEQALYTNLREALSGKGESVLKELYAPNEIARIERFVTALDTIRKKGDFARSSGTAERFWRWSEGVIGNLPFIGSLQKLRQTVEAQSALSYAQPYVTPRALPAAASMAAGQ